MGNNVFTWGGLIVQPEMEPVENFVTRPDR